MITTPSVIARYYAASEAGDVDRTVACFSPRASVVDDGWTHDGTDEIRAWRDGLASAFTYTLVVTGIDRVRDREYVVTTHLEGDFPGGSVDLTNRFTLGDGLILSLVI